MNTLKIKFKRFYSEILIVNASKFPLCKCKIFYVTEENGLKREGKALLNFLVFLGIYVK